MKRPFAIALFAVALTATLLWNIKSPIQPPSLEVLTGQYNQTKIKIPVMTELGIPSETSYPDESANSRNPWDMAVFDGKLYIGCGDYGDNTGPCEVWRYDPDTQSWTDTGTVNDEAVANFEIIDEQLIITGTDPKDDWEYGSFYTYTSDGWQTDRSVPFGVHMFDIAELNGQTFYGIGNAKYTQSPVQMTENGLDYTNVQFFIGDEALVGNPDYGYSRCYNLFESSNELYAFCCWSNSPNGKKLYSFFKYDGQAFRLVSHIKDLNVKSAASNRQVLLNKALFFDGKYYFSLGTLYSTKDFKTVKTVSSPQDAIVQDMVVQNGKMYVLTSRELGKEAGITTFIDTEAESGTDSSQKETGYKNTVFEYSEANGFTEIFSFEYGLSAMSFEKHNDTYYIGIGKAIRSDESEDFDSSAPLHGMILKVEFVETVVPK